MAGRCATRGRRGSGSRRASGPHRPPRGGKQRARKLPPRHTPKASACVRKPLARAVQEHLPLTRQTQPCLDLLLQFEKEPVTLNEEMLSAMADHVAIIEGAWLRSQLPLRTGEPATRVPGAALAYTRCGWGATSPCGRSRDHHRTPQEGTMPTQGKRG